MEVFICDVRKCPRVRIRRFSNALRLLLNLLMLFRLLIAAVFVFKEAFMLKFSFKDVISNASFWRFLCDTIIAFGKLLTFIIDGNFDSEEDK